MLKCVKVGVNSVISEGVTSTTVEMNNCSPGWGPGVLRDLGVYKSC